MSPYRIGYPYYVLKEKIYVLDRKIKTSEIKLVNQTICVSNSIKHSNVLTIKTMFSIF